VNTCIVIPHYDHLVQFRRFLPRLAAVGLPIIVVDDASPGSTAEALNTVLDELPVETKLVCHSVNRGKGGAVMTGLRTASEAGFTHALQIDADGQHDCADIDSFLKAASERPRSVICGKPVFDESISSLRYYGRFVTLLLACIETLSRDIHDALCGFRIYPLDSITAIINKSRLATRMAFDPELLVRTVWHGIPLHYIPVNVTYPEDGKSHFHYWRDNVEISWMHTRLIIGMVLRLPILLTRKITRRGAQAS
jgi:glycosyltransferase involved in cell wall biosynthesis